MIRVTNVRIIWEGRKKTNLPCNELMKDSELEKYRKRWNSLPDIERVLFTYEEVEDDENTDRV